MPNNIRNKLTIKNRRLDEINSFLTDSNNKLVNNLLSIIEKYGGIEEINRKFRESGRLENLMARLKKKNSPYIKDLEWLIEQRDKGSFITIDQYRKKVLGKKAENIVFNEDYAVTLEISACQYFSSFMTEARQAVKKQELMPGRFIRVRCMKEQEEDDDLLAMAAAMQIIGTSWC